MNPADTKPNYADYLQIDRILSAQAPLSSSTGRPAHDEMLFIIVHQTYELWFKQILHEIDSVLDMFAGRTVDENRISTAVARIGRITEIQRLLIEQIAILETMTPLDFLDFRNLLTGASGFQSAQFRLIENKLGLRPETRVTYGEAPYGAHLCPHVRGTVEAAAAAPTFFDLVEDWLERTPFLSFGTFNFVASYQAAHARMVAGEKNAIDAATALSPEERRTRHTMLDHSSEYAHRVLSPEGYAGLRASGAVRLSYPAFMAVLFIHLYRDQPILHAPFRLLAGLIQLDEYFEVWRHRHALMVSRMIGAKMGTGGSTGHTYLAGTIEKHRIFGDLFAVSTLLIPRAELPPLPPDLETRLGFYFSTAAQPTSAPLTLGGE
jgi:tryptophan 2,3-dioxygenase